MSSSWSTWTGGWQKAFSQTMAGIHQTASSSFAGATSSSSQDSAPSGMTTAASSAKSRLSPQSKLLLDVVGSAVSELVAPESFKVRILTKLLRIVADAASVFFPAKDNDRCDLRLDLLTFAQAGSVAADTRVLRLAAALDVTLNHGVILRNSLGFFPKHATLEHKGFLLSF